MSGPTTFNDKSAFSSMTIWGLLITVLVFVKDRFGFNFTESEIESVVNAVALIVAVITSAIGRFRKGDLYVKVPQLPPPSIRMLLVFLFVSLLSISGCSNSIPVAPVKTYTDTVGEKWDGYVEDDPSLTELEKKTYHQFHADFSAMVDQAAQNQQPTFFPLPMPPN